MTNIEDLFCFRRSTRKFKADQVPDESIQKIIEAGQTAPLAMGNDKTTHITVVQNREVLEMIRKCCMKESRKTPGKMLDSLYGAPVFIILSAADVSDDHIEYCDVACVIENMILEATNLGLGSCYIWGCLRKLRKSPETMAKLNIPDGYEILSAMVCGYPEKPLEARERKSRITVNMI